MRFAIGRDDRHRQIVAHCDGVDNPRRLLTHDLYFPMGAVIGDNPARPVVAPRLSMPTLYIVAPDDEVAGASPAVAKECFETIPGSKEWIDIEGGHFGLLHEDSPLFQKALTADLQFLEMHFQ